MFGLRGDIVHDWKYDLSYTYGVSQDTDQLQASEITPSFCSSGVSKIPLIPTTPMVR